MAWFLLLDYNVTVKVDFPYWEINQSEYRGHFIMQCYEYQMKLAQIYTVVTLVNPEFERDDFLLSDILADVGVDTIEELLNIDQSTIIQIAGPYIKNFNKAA